MDYMEGYLLLAENIVQFAAKDYERLIKLSRRRKLSVFEESELYKIRRFFRSWWFDALSVWTARSFCEKSRSNA